eukprot:Selendium_serpulae@DN4721_c0_g1_i1.p1
MGIPPDTSKQDIEFFDFINGTAEECWRESHSETCLPSEWTVFAYFRLKTLLHEPSPSQSFAEVLENVRAEFVSLKSSTDEAKPREAAELKIRHDKMIQYASAVEKMKIFENLISGVAAATVQKK